MKAAIIGAGISGASCANMLVKDKHEVCVYEANQTPGGLVRCSLENEVLFHRVGGHVFNSKFPEVLDWFWVMFDKEKEFLLAERNAAIYIDNKFLSYPIEENIYNLGHDVAKQCISELLEIYRKQAASNVNVAKTFGQFLLERFGKTLFTKYFKPYNEKIWQHNLDEMPLEWLQGKFPMPTAAEIIETNMLRAKESNMVHSTFYYPRRGGSQFIIDRILEGIDIKCSHKVESVKKERDGLRIDKTIFDKIIYTGDIRKVFEIFEFAFENISQSENEIISRVKQLRVNKTSNILCECDNNPYSWIYLPESDYPCHRMIMTGNFSKNNNNNNNKDKTSCTIEFSGTYSTSEMIDYLSSLPFSPKFIASNVGQESYVIQDTNTRSDIDAIKGILERSNIYLCGRFAEWEYFNMDAAINSAQKLMPKVTKKSD